jgi:hypothetical protein
MVKNTKKNKQFNPLLLVVVLGVLMFLIFSIYALVDQTSKYGIGALEEQVHQKYLQEQKTPESQKSEASASAEASGEHTNVYTYTSGNSF